MDYKKVSLILTTYNCVNNLKKTLKSIEEQDYPNIEIVIKDGLSSDGTLNIIKEFEKESRHYVIWESKKDIGIYDAMNQGYELCSGDIIAFFNDTYTVPSAITKLVTEMEKINISTGKPYIGVHADLVYVEGDKILRKWKMGRGSIYQGWMPGHPTLFLRREVYEKFGLYNTEFKIGGDYEFMIRFLKEGNNELAYLPEVIVAMFYGGTSSNGLKSYLLSFKEGHRALRINNIRWAGYIDFLRILRVLLQFAR